MFCASVNKNNSVVTWPLYQASQQTTGFYHSSASVYYTECTPKNKNGGSLRTRIVFTCIVTNCIFQMLRINFKHPISGSTHISVIFPWYTCYSILLLKYLSECKRHGRDCHIRAVLLISVIWDVKATDNIHQPLNKYTLNRHLSNNFKGILKE